MRDSDIGFRASGGNKFEIINFQLVANTDTKIEFSQKVKSVAIQARTAVDLLLSVTDALGGTTYWTIKSGTVHGFDIASGNIDESLGTGETPSTGKALWGWVRSTGTPFVEIIGMYD